MLLESEKHPSVGLSSVSARHFWSSLQHPCHSSYANVARSELQLHSLKKINPKPTLDTQILCRLGAKTLLKLIGINGCV